ncbi:MAG: hypothetical protein ACLSU9_11055 [Anaerovoracaceae bacterium]
MRPYIIQFNHHTSDDFGVVLYSYEIYSGGQKNYTTTAVAGRLGQLVSQDVYKSNLVIGVTFSILSYEFMAKICQLKEWLKGTGNLTFSDNADCFYKVLKINYGNIERDTRNYGRFTVSFECVPYEFLKNGTILINQSTNILRNPYSASRPIYKITGEGNCELNVNGNAMIANVGQNLTINTELMIAYREDGEVQNATVTGDYEKLYLSEGENILKITEGFELKIIPNWGYEI